MTPVTAFDAGEKHTFVPLAEGALAALQASVGLLFILLRRFGFRFGFRAYALVSLTAQSFDLNNALPTVTLAAQFNKNRKPKVQPLPSELVGLLRDYLSGKPAKQPLWDGNWAWYKHGAEMLRVDSDGLETAGDNEAAKNEEYAENTGFCLKMAAKREKSSPRKRFGLPVFQSVPQKQEHLIVCWFRAPIANDDNGY